jgi:hypothetical protein
LQTAALPLGYPAESCFQSRFVGFLPFVFCLSVPVVANFRGLSERQPLSGRQLRIIPYNGNRAYKYYLDGYKVNGKRKRLFFKDQGAARRNLAELTRQQRKEGQDGLNITLDLRVLAAKAARRLAPFNKSVLDAAEFYASHLERESSWIQVSEAVEDYLNSKVRAGFSKRHLRDIRGRIGRFSKSFGVRLIRTVTVREVEDWLHDLSLGPQSVVNYRAVVHAFFAHCVKRRLVETNPIGAIDKVKLVDKAPEILTPEQLFGLLSAAPCDLLAGTCHPGFRRPSNRRDYAS